MKSFSLILLIALGLIVFAGLNSFYTVRQDKQALVVRLGNPVEVRNEYKLNEAGEEVDEAGLFFKIPFIENVITFERKNIGTGIANIEVLASDQRRLTVDAFVRWRISNPLEFYQRLGNEQRASSQLQLITESSIRNALAQVPVPEIVSGQRVALMEQIRATVDASLSDNGIDIIDVRIRQADLPETVQEGVYKRMRTERDQEAQRIRSEGDEQAKLIRATAQREATVLEAQAREESEKIRGEGDALRNKIYADAYSKDPEFFRFQRALIACEEAIQEGTQIVVAPENMDLCQVFIDRARAAGR